MKRINKNIVLVVLLCAATVVTAQKPVVVKDYTSWPIDTTGAVQKYTGTIELLVSIASQAQTVGVDNDTRRTVKIDSAGNYNVQSDSRTVRGWTIGAGVGADIDIKAKDKDVYCFGPLFRLYGSYYGPWYEFAVNLDYTRQANPLQAGEAYWAWGFHVNPKFFLARWPENIDYNVFYIDLVAGVQQAKTASRLFYEDETVTVNFVENSTDFTYCMGAGIGYQHRFFSNGSKIGVQLDCITYGGTNINKVAHNGTILVDNKEKIRMWQPRLTVYYGFTIGKRSASYEKYTRKQFKMLQEAARRIEAGEWPPVVEQPAAE